MDAEEIVMASNELTHEEIEEQIESINSLRLYSNFRLDVIAIFKQAHSVSYYF